MSGLSELRRIAEAASENRLTQWDAEQVIYDVLTADDGPGTRHGEPLAHKLAGRIALALYGDATEHVSAVWVDRVLALLDRIGVLEAAATTDGRCADCRRGHYSIPGGGTTNFPCTTGGCTCWICHDGDGQPIPDPAPAAGEQDR